MIADSESSVDELPNKGRRGADKGRKPAGNRNNMARNSRSSRCMTAISMSSGEGSHVLLKTHVRLTPKTPILVVGGAACGACRRVGVDHGFNEY
jgi:hypothetical protein